MPVITDALALLTKDEDISYLRKNFLQLLKEGGGFSPPASPLACSAMPAIDWELKTITLIRQDRDIGLRASSFLLSVIMQKLNVPQ